MGRLTILVDDVLNFYQTNTWVRLLNERIPHIEVLKFEGHGDRILEHAHVPCGGGEQGPRIPSLLPHRRPIYMLNRPGSRGLSGDAILPFIHHSHS